MTALLKVQRADRSSENHIRVSIQQHSAHPTCSTDRITESCTRSAMLHQTNMLSLLRSSVQQPAGDSRSRQPLLPSAHSAKAFPPLLRPLTLRQPASPHPSHTFTHRSLTLSLFSLTARPTAPTARPSLPAPHRQLAPQPPLLLGPRPLLARCCRRCRSHCSGPL
jgi:hypothetical protein